MGITNSGNSINGPQQGYNQFGQQQQYGYESHEYGQYRPGDEGDKSKFNWGMTNKEEVDPGMTMEDDPNNLAREEGICIHGGG